MVNSRGELLARLARLLVEAGGVVAELAALEGATVGETPAPPSPPRSRPRARPARVPCNDVLHPPALTDLDAAEAARIREGVARKLRIQPR